MDWLNLHIPTVIRSPSYVGSSPAERGTWLSVMSYACEIECGGRIVGAARWKDRQWQQACGVTLREVRAADRLLAVEGDDVVVNGYPVEKQRQVQQARGVATAGAMARWGKRDAVAHAATMPVGIKPAMPVGNAEGEGEGEGEGEERAACNAASLGTWIRTKTRDQSRTDENASSLDALCEKYGRAAVQAAAERIVVRKHQKIWPDDADMLADLHRNSEEGLGYTREDALRSLGKLP